MKGQRTNFWMLAACAAMALTGVGGASALAAETHQFDPMLSLTGNCDVSQIDPIADPGPCPIPPGVAGVDHPSQPFASPSGVATDSYGNIYVANAAAEGSAEGRIDIFDSSGNFITELEDPEGPQAVAVDSAGYLYVSHVGWEKPEYSVVRYEPTVYEPASGKIKYDLEPVGLVGDSGSIFDGLAVNPSNDHLFVKFSGYVAEYKSAAEGNDLIEEFGYGLVAGVSTEPVGLAIDQARGRIYVGGANESGCPCVYVLSLAPPHELLFTIKGTVVPAGKFLTGSLSLAVDEGTGHFFVYDGLAKKVYEFDQGGSYVGAIEHSFQYVFGAEIGVDNGKNSPNGALNPTGRYLYVPSHPSGTGHSFAFGPSNEGAPSVESVSFANVGEHEAELRASIEPFGLPTHYVFEYTTQRHFEEEGESFTGAQVAGEGEIPAGNAPVSVAATATGLQPGVAYRFRVVATNPEGSDSGAGLFATYPAADPFPPCPNEALRTGFSALLPDCRAYELVTPPDTNARSPLGTASVLGSFFAASQASPAGDRFSFRIEGGTIPGSEAVGSLAGDPYVSSRGEGGWSTSYAGPNGAEAASLLPGSTSPDQGYSFWIAEGQGSALIEGRSTTYVRYPDGHSALVGRGSLGADPRAQGKLISEGGGHIIFFSPNFTEGSFKHPAVQLEPNAPPDGTQAIYDRTADEVTHVVSLLPGNVTPAEGENAMYEGASLDGTAVAFRIGKTLYLRHDNEETFEIGEGVTFAGVAEASDQIFYLEGGNLYRLDLESGERVPFTTTGDVTVINVSEGGSVAYFVSPSALAGQENPQGAKPAKGKENLYRSKEGDVSFVGTVAEEDVEGAESGVGLGTWVPHVASYGEAAEDPSRTTSNGDVLLFESRASLTGYDTQGHVEVYRYDATAGELACLSCNPTLAPASGEASLQSMGRYFLSPEPLGIFARVANLSPDGRRAFFQSTEALVPTDNDGLQDVYEWEAQGAGSCGKAAGCVYLISSGESRRIDYLFAVSELGDDVFFRTGDLLLPSDLEETPSIYDARVNGGFPEAAEEPCRGEGCRPTLTPPPGLPSPGMLSSGHTGNWRPSRACPKGKRKVRRHGKVRCVKKHRKHRHHRKAGSTKKGGRK